MDDGTEKRCKGRRLMVIMFSPVTIQEIVLKDMLELRNCVVIEMNPNVIADMVLITNSLYFSFQYEKYKDRTNKRYVGDGFPVYINDALSLDDLLDTCNTIASG